MRPILLSVLAITLLQGCGSGGSNASSHNVTPTPGPLPQQTIYTMTSSRTQPGDVLVPSSQPFSTSGSALLPNTTSGLSDLGENINAVLTIGSVTTCNYTKPPGVSVYTIQNCTSGYTGNSNVTFPANTTITFNISSGYCTQNCSSAISITVTQ